MTYAELHETLENLKYLNRLSKQEFLDLLFDNDEPTGYYAEMKWVLFQKSPLHFMWSCSSDNIRLLSDYIDSFKPSFLLHDPINTDHPELVEFEGETLGDTLTNLITEVQRLREAIMVATLDLEEPNMHEETRNDLLDMLKGMVE
tara:strand:- start:29850 stop:30284 length:435 start_codon:yes stop_codon:yes gene_type:complete